MDVSHSPGPDGYDLWAALNASAAVLTILSLTSEGNESQEFGIASALVTAESTLLHAVTTPPRCPNCQSRTHRPSVVGAYGCCCPNCGYRSSPGSRPA